MITEPEQRWVILVGGGHGAYVIRGTLSQAEEHRCHKANWEHAIAKKRLADPYETEDAPAVSACWNHPGFKNKFWYECDCGECDSQTRTRTARETGVDAK